MYRVNWVHRAVADLRFKVKSRAVQMHLVAVSEDALDRHFPAWGGEAPARGLLWRRGVTAREEERLELSATEPQRLHESREAGHDYVLVYRRAHEASGTQRCYEIMAVLTNGELAAGQIDLF